MSPRNRSILVRAPFAVIFLVFVPSLPVVNEISGLQAACWILAGAVTLVAIGMGLGSVIERRESSRDHDKRHLPNSQHLQHGDDAR